MARALIDLLEQGLHLGVATGRGRSAFDDLKQAIPDRLWSRVLVGMYNGHLCVPLSDPQPPSRVSEPSAALEPAARILRRFTSLLGISLDERQAQLSIVPDEHSDLDRLRNSITDLIGKDPSLRVVASTHSIDVIPAAVTKRNVVGAIREHAGGRSGGDDEVLCIGDRGDSGGNDFDLLALPLGLSTDRVSAALDRCWNLSPPGTRGPAATLTYLSAIRAVDDGFALDVEALRVLS